MGAKQTGQLIPLCHNIPLSNVRVDLQLVQGDKSVAITAEARTAGQTGVEMEALTAVSIAALTVYDMCKAVSKDMRIADIRLEAKSGGRSGSYSRGDEREGSARTSEQKGNVGQQQQQQQQQQEVSILAG